MDSIEIVSTTFDLFDVGTAEHLHMATTSTSVQLSEEPAFTHRKKFKTSELPLNSAQRSGIDGLLHTLKKKGEYDALRKKVWSQYAESVSVTIPCQILN